MHAGNIEEQTAGLFRILPQFLVIIAIAGHGVNRAVDIIKAVIVIRAVYAIRQVALDIFAEIAHITPCRTNVGLGDFIIQFDIDDHLSRTIFAFYRFQMRRILQAFFQFVRDLLLHFLCRSARPGRRYDHLPDGELRVFHTPQLKVGYNPADSRNDDKIPDQGPILETDFC